jgi:hypothetical protein
MPVYYFIYLIILLGSFFLLVRYFVYRKKSLAMLLFIAAIKAENQGNYQEASDAYENALCEVKKSRFDRYLKIKILEKLKLLQTLKTYKKDQVFVRKDYSAANK